MKPNLAKHTLIIQEKSELFLLYQVITRKGVLIEKFFFDETLSNDTTKKYQFKDISSFSLSKTLVDNPNGISNNLDNISLDYHTKDEIIKKCYDLSIFSEDDNYYNFLGIKTSFFDRDHIGNFHQQIGEYVLKTFKQDSEDWWIYQKFDKSLDQTKNNPYRWVQEVFIKSFFTESLMKDKIVLDFGGGVGYYSNFFASLASKVDSVDPSEYYIDIAKKKFGKRKNLNFFVANFENKSDFGILDKKYDYIFLCDVFLYFFVPYKKLELTPDELLIQLRSKLNKGGKIFIMDPHGVFHLQPWFNSQKPFMISAEYATKKYRVTPNLEEMSLAVEKANMHISKIRELKYNGSESDKTFYKEFPFWWFFELSKNET